MGWQSYVFGCDDKARLDKVMAAIEKHNILCFSPEARDHDRVGEALGCVSFHRQRKKFGSQHVLFVICGHGGGRTSTFEFFKSEGVHVWPYNKAHEKRLEEIEYTYDPESDSVWPSPSSGDDEKSDEMIDVENILEDVGIADVAGDALRETVQNELNKWERIKWAAENFANIQGFEDICFKQQRAVLVGRGRSRKLTGEYIVTLETKRRTIGTSR